ncbi:MAG: hypothetical protein LBR83_10885, partial [Clostridiales bacterium]|nr:hypothetical protein [Clostridiales bacterium]
MTVSHNIPSLLIHTNLQKNDRLLSGALRRLGSGYKISSAKDDAAGLAISNKLSMQISSLERASQNATHGVSLVQTAEGALSEVHTMIQRMRELAVQAANEVNNADDREKIQQEIDELVEEINKVAERTDFNKIKLLSGEANRVNKSYVDNVVGVAADNVLDINVAKLLYFSDETPSGEHTYTITAPGTPAIQIGALPAASNPTDKIGDLLSPLPAGMDADDLEMEIMINGEKLKIKGSDTLETVQAGIRSVCYFTGLDYRVNEATDETLIMSKVAGSDQEIDIRCNISEITQDGVRKLTPGDRDKLEAELMSFFGFSEGISKGTDAVIEFTATDINDNFSYKAVGNRIEAIGTNGEFMQFNLQVNYQTFNAGGVTFQYGGDAINTFTATEGAPDDVDGNPDTPAVSTTSVPAAASRNMMFDIKEYGPIMLQIGANYGNNMAVAIPRLDAETLGFVEYKSGEMFSMLNYMNTPGASKAIDQCDSALAVVSTVRSRLGAFQNRLEATIRSVDTASENTESSRSLIRDTDMAKDS